jgi:hypothetical protein
MLVTDVHMPLRASVLLDSIELRRGKNPTNGMEFTDFALPKEIGPLHLWLREPTQNARFQALFAFNHPRRWPPSAKSPVTIDRPDPKLYRRCRVDRENVVRLSGDRTLWLRARFDYIVMGIVRHRTPQNGNLKDIRTDIAIRPGVYHPLGETHSEYAFCDPRRMRSVWYSRPTVLKSYRVMSFPLAGRRLSIQGNRLAAVAP